LNCTILIGIFKIHFARHDQWFGLKSIGMAESERRIGEEVKMEQRYLITSLDNNVAQFGNAVRKYCGIENS